MNLGSSVVVDSLSMGRKPWLKTLTALCETTVHSIGKALGVNPEENLVYCNPCKLWYKGIAIFYHSKTLWIEKIEERPSVTSNL